MIGKEFGIVFLESPDAILIIDGEEGNVLAVNKSVTNILGYEEKDLRGKNFSILFPREMGVKDLPFLISGEGRGSCKILTSSGSTCLMDLTATIVPWNDKKIVIATFRDITGRKCLEDALKDSEGKYRQLIELVKEGIWVFDRSRRTAFVNPSMACMLGYSVDEMIGKSAECFISIPDFSDIKDFLDFFGNKQEFELICKDKKKIYTKISISLINDMEGNYTGVLAVVTDITERKKIEEQNNRCRYNLEAILRSVQDGMIAVDKNLVLTEINEAACNICGFSRDAIGKSLDSLGCEGKCIQSVLEAINKEVPSRMFRIKCQPFNNPARLISLTASPLLNKQGNSIGAVMVITDETRLATLDKEAEDRKEYHKIIGKSKKMQKLYSMIETLSDVSSTVLITGESGTGKELVAEALHYVGARTKKPLVKVNCSALPETLLESELFGHVKGAFTGAIKNKPGLFERADGGTIFLDEIGDITPAMQIRLLRVLQESEFERVGDTKSIKLDVRVIAATNQKLQEKVKAGLFREDLYYRLKVVELELPPLRERKEDIPLLTAHFLKKFSEKFKKEIVALSENVKKIFISHSWPGNIRELEHALEHACILSSGSFITEDDLPKDLLVFPAELIPSYNEKSDREAIVEALEKTAGNKAKAARLLGISRQTIYRKIKEYSISI